MLMFLKQSRGLPMRFNPSSLSSAEQNEQYQARFHLKTSACEGGVV